MGFLVVAPLHTNQKASQITAFSAVKVYFTRITSSQVVNHNGVARQPRQLAQAA